MAGNVYLWSTTAATNSASDADINWVEGQLPGTVNDSARGMMAGIAGWLKDTNSTLTTGGSANAQTVTSNVAYVALATGMRLHLKAGFSNTAAATLNLTPAGGAAFGAKAIKIIIDSGETDPVANNIRINGHYVFEYDSAANAAAGAWILLNPSASIVAPGLLLGLTLSNSVGDLTNDIDIATGLATDSTNAVQITLAGVLTKQLDAVWAVGTNAGMLASGAAIANTTYHIFLIRRPDTGVVDIAADTSVTGANITANTNVAYTQFRRIGSIMRVAAAIVLFTQLGDEFLRKTTILDITASNPGTSAATRTLSVPIGIQIGALFHVLVTNLGTSVNFGVVMSELDRTDEAPSFTIAPLFSSGDAISGGFGAPNTASRMTIRTNTSAQIRSRCGPGSDGNCVLRIATIGWVDTRGRI